MSARDDYPRIGRTQLDLLQWKAMCDEIDQLRADLAAMTEVAGNAIALAMEGKP